MGDGRPVHIDAGGHGMMSWPWPPVSNRMEVAVYVVIGTAPTVDGTVVVGPFRTAERASEAWMGLAAKGYNAETCDLERIEEVPYVRSWDGGE